MTYIHGIFNAKKCAAYLRGIGVELLPTEVARWMAQERQCRADRKRVQRTEALQCADCRARWEVTFRRRSKQLRCPHCGSPRQNQMWLLEIVRGSGDRQDHREGAARWGYDGERGPTDAQDGDGPFGLLGLLGGSDD